MGKIAFILSLSLLSLGWAGEYDDFEKSLMNSPSEVSSENESDSATVSTDAFEQSLMTNADYADMEPVYKLRETLLENVKNKDTAKVSENIRELEALKTRECVPILDVEKKFIYLDLKMYSTLVSHLVYEYKAVYDTLEVDPGYRVAKDDGLNLYIKNLISNLDTSSTSFYSRYEQSIKSSKINDEQKDELEILMQLDGVYWAEKNLNNVRALAERFVNDYPNNPDVPWIKKAALEPMQRMDTFGMYMGDRAKNKDRLIESKYYTGGLGFNLYLLGSGMVVSGFDDIYRSDVLEGDVDLVHMEFYVQFSSIALSLGYFNTGLVGIEAVDLTAGYVVYDSRHLKIRPFFGISTPFTHFKVKEDFCLGAESYYGSGSQYIKGEELDDNLSESIAGWVLGTNVDFKFATTYFLISDSMLTSFALVGRFGVSSLDLNGEVIKGSGYSAFFSLGFGIYFW